jgi:uncharacterized membrane protein YgdD (TMEM256/DUF423 family)
MERTFLALGAIFALLGVAAGAFGAHALRSKLPTERMSNVQTAVQYQMWHALALFVAAWAAAHCGGVGIVAGVAFAAGIVLFSGSLYALALTGRRTWGAVTPFGGVAFIIGWALVLVGAIRR